MLINTALVTILSYDVTRQQTKKNYNVMVMEMIYSNYF